jgi:Ca2+-binding EF-hand superfamily protein
MNACNNVVLEKEIKLLLDRMDKDKDSLISFAEFLNEIEPKQFK